MPTYSSHKGAIALLGSTLWLNFALLAQEEPDVNIEILIGPDVVVTGGGEMDFNFLQVPRFNSLGDGITMGAFDGMEGQFFVGGDAIFKLNGPDSLELLLREDGERKFDSFDVDNFYPTIGLGTVFQGIETDETQSSIFRYDPGALVEIHDGGFLLNASNTGKVVFANQNDDPLASNVSVIRSSESPEPVVLVDTVTPLPGLGGATFAEWGKVHASPTGGIALFGRLEGGTIETGKDWGLFRETDDNVFAMVLQQGDAYPQTQGLVIGGQLEFLQVNQDGFGFNSTGDIAFEASILSPTQANVNVKSLWLLKADDSLSLIAAEDLATDTLNESSVTFSDFNRPHNSILIQPMVVSSGDVYFVATSSSGLDALSPALWRLNRENNSIERIVTFNNLPFREIKDSQLVEIENKDVRVQKMSISKGGRVAIFGNVRSGSTFIGNGLWAQDEEGNFALVATQSSRPETEEFEQEDLFLTGGANIGRIVSLLTPTLSGNASGSEDGLGVPWWTPSEQLMFTARILNDGLLVDYICQATVGELALNSVGVDYIWDGGAGTGDWHTVTDGRSNWVDAFGTPWPQPPGGGSGNEVVLIGPEHTVELNADASISDLELNGSTLAVKANLSFKDLLNVEPEGQLRVHFGSIQSSTGDIEMTGKIVKRSAESFELKVVDLDMVDSEISVEEGLLSVESEQLRILGEGAEVTVSGGDLDLSSKTLSLEANTILESAEGGTIKVGSELPESILNFSGGTDINKRRLTFKGRGVVELRVPFTVGAADEVYVENSSVQFNGGVIVNLPAGKVIEAIGNFYNFGEVTLQRGGLVGEVESTGLIVVQAANANDEISFGGTSFGRFELRSNVNYKGTLANLSGSIFRTYGATLSPSDPLEDILIFDRRSKLIAKEGISEIQFPTTETSRLSCPINIEGSASLGISDSRMTEKVKIVVESTEGSVVLENTEFEKLFIEGEGNSILRGKLQGKGPGGLPQIAPYFFVENGAFITQEFGQVFGLETKTFQLESTELIGAGEGNLSTYFVLGDSTSNLSELPTHSGSLSAVKIGPRATLVNSQSTSLTVESVVSLEYQFFNYGVIMLKADVLAFPDGNDSALFTMGVFPGVGEFNFITVPPNLQEAVVFEPDFAAAFGGINVQEGSTLSFSRFSKTLDDDQTLQFGTWNIQKSASVLFKKANESIETIKPIISIGHRASLSINGLARDGFPAINGFPDRTVDLSINGRLRLFDTVLNMSNNRIRNRNNLTSIRSTINGEVISLIEDLQGSVSVAQLNLDEGIINGNVTMGGVTGLGASPGEGLINGDLTMLPEARLNIEFAGTEAKTQYDQLEVTGTANLDGTLVLHLLDGYEPTGGEQFEFLRAPTITGSFAEIDQRRLGRNVRFDFATGSDSILATAMSISIASYSDWKEFFFSEADAANDEVSGQLRDPDKDGLTNLEEYATGGIPTLSGEMPIHFDIGDINEQNERTLGATFNWVTDVTDAQWAFEKSTDLVNWEAIDPEVSTETDGDLSLITLTSSETVENDAPRFLRIAITELAP